MAVYTDASEIFNESLTEVVCNLKIINEGKNVKFYMADTFKLLQFAVENGEDLDLKVLIIPVHGLVAWAAMCLFSGTVFIRPRSPISIWQPWL